MKKIAEFSSYTCAVVQHKRRRDLEFVIAIVAEDGYISNLFETKNGLFSFSLRG